MVAVLSLHKVTAIPESFLHLGRHGPWQSPGLQEGEQRSPVPGWGRALARDPNFRVGKGEAGGGQAHFPFALVL